MRAQTLAAIAMRPQIRRMVVFSCEGVRSVDDRDVLYVFREPSITSRWCHVTLVMANGEEISGRAIAEAVSALQTKLAEHLPAA